MTGSGGSDHLKGKSLSIRLKGRIGHPAMEETQKRRKENSAQTLSKIVAGWSQKTRVWGLELAFYVTEQKFNGETPFGSSEL